MKNVSKYFPEWQKYRKMMVNKGTGKKDKKKNLGQTNCIIVQKMNPTVTGKSKKTKKNYHKKQENLQVSQIFHD